MCSYECDQGYEKLTGTLTCQDGVLKPLNIDLLGSDELLCKPKSCSEIIPNGALADECTPQVGNLCEYTCNSGYSKPSYYLKIFCNSTTNWSPNPHSLCTNGNQCHYDIPGLDLDLFCQRHPGDQCRYTCREGFVHSHYATADCTGRLDWMQREDSLCLEIKCSIYIDNGYIPTFPCSRKYGETCLSYECYDPYIKPPRSIALKCNASSNLGYRNTAGFWDWDKSKGKPCVKKEDLCPSKFSNGEISSDCSLQPGVECPYTCNAECVKNPTVPVVHCSQSMGQWREGTDRLCTNCVRCPDTIDNGRLFSFSCELRPSTTCSFACDYGCRKVTDTLTCQENGEWSHRPCICAEQDTGFANSSSSDDQGSSSTITVVIVIIVMVLAIILVLSVVYWFRHRRQRDRQPPHAYETGVPMITPSAPPLEGNTSAPGYQPNPYRQTNTAQGRSDIDSGQREIGYSDPSEKETDSNEPPPSYEQVTADPSIFKT